MDTAHTSLRLDDRPVVRRPRRSALIECLMVEAAVAASFRIPRTIFHAPNRCPAPIAFARQIAMYVAHVWLGLTLTDVGRYFGRDRTTVSHACRLVEDRREDPRIDRLLSSIESAVDVWRTTGQRIGAEL